MQDGGRSLDNSGTEADVFGDLTPSRICGKISLRPRSLATVLREVAVSEEEFLAVGRCQCGEADGQGILSRREPFDCNRVAAFKSAQTSSHQRSPIRSFYPVGACFLPVIEVNGD